MAPTMSTLRLPIRVRIAIAIALAGGSGTVVLRLIARTMYAFRKEQLLLAESTLTPDQRDLARTAARSNPKRILSGPPSSEQQQQQQQQQQPSTPSAQTIDQLNNNNNNNNTHPTNVAASNPQPDTSHPSVTRQPSQRSLAQAGIDKRFVARLMAILRICIPGITSREAALVVLQGILLLCRTFLSDAIARIEGICGERVTGQDWEGFKRILLTFAAVAVPASVVNAALKTTQILVQLAFRKRLTAYLHKAYLENRAYYSASVLGGLSHADQRITDDVEKFCESIAELYSNTFKPLFDILLFTRSLSQIMGIRGQLFLHSYFILIGAFLRAISPPLSLMTTQYSALNATFRTAHSRITSTAEEIAFNDPPAGRAEMLALNRRLENMLRHSHLTAFQRFVQSCVDGYLTKYTASVIGLCIFAVPLYYTVKTHPMDANVIAGKYINAMRLMMQSASAMGQLVLVHKRIHTLAGHTARVSELLEEVKALAKPNGSLSIFRRAQNRVQLANTKNGTASETTPLLPREGLFDDAIALSCVNGSLIAGSFSDIKSVHSAKPARSLNGPHIKLEDVSVWAPDGSLLVKDLNIEVQAGSSLIIEGPNGCGKSSILRVLAGLWPLQSGTVTLPPRSSMFFLSQRPYLFSGGTLGEQLMYPNLPNVVVGECVELDQDRARMALADAQLEHLVTRAKGFDGVLAWDDVLSGGERNRLAVARLLYHRPAFAILDECTAAVSSDGEVALYRAMASAGITLLSVAHRKAVRNFHQLAVVLDGDHGWEVQAISASETPQEFIVE